MYIQLDVRITTTTQRYPRDVLSIDPDTAVSDVIETEQQSDDGTLAAAAAPHQRVRLPGRHRETEVAQHRFPVCEQTRAWLSTAIRFSSNYIFATGRVA